MKIEVDDDISLRVIHRGVGGITKSDIDLALADDVIVLGFNVRAEGQATELANREGVDVRYYTVIYQAIDEIEAALKGMLKPLAINSPSPPLPSPVALSPSAAPQFRYPSSCCPRGYHELFCRGQHPPSDGRQPSDPPSARRL
jgi:hypothetical protein